MCKCKSRISYHCISTELFSCIFVTHGADVSTQSQTLRLRQTQLQFLSPGFQCNRAVASGPHLRVPLKGLGWGGGQEGAGGLRGSGGPEAVSGRRGGSYENSRIDRDSPLPSFRVSAPCLVQKQNTPHQRENYTFPQLRGCRLVSNKGQCSSPISQLSLPLCFG